MEKTSVYFEKQVLLRCGLHAVNNLLGDKIYSPKQFSEFCKELERSELGKIKYQMILNLGNYDADVLLLAMQKRGLVVTWFPKSADFGLINYEGLTGMLINMEDETSVLEKNHWFSIRRVNDYFYWLDSKKPSPAICLDAVSIWQRMQRKLAKKTVTVLLVHKPEFSDVLLSPSLDFPFQSATDNEGLLIKSQDNACPPSLYHWTERDTQNAAAFQGRLGSISLLPENSNFHFCVKGSDVVFPVCSAGENRSQVVLPHGAESGYDPHQISDELNEKNFIEYLNSIVTQDTIDKLAFIRAFGRRKAARFGFAEGRLMGLNDNRDFVKLRKNRRNMQQYFSHNYYNVQRLLEANTTVDFSNVHIVGLPFGDEVTQAKSVDEMTIIYREMFDCYAKLFRFIK